MITEHAETPQHVFSLYPCDLSDDSGFDEALRRMMGTAFPAESEHVEDALRLLITSAEQYPVELSDEAVLFHVHCEKITRPALVVGRGREWKEISREKPAYRIILALFSPKTMSAEHHLKALARIGRTFHNAAIIEKIHAASTAADICMILEDNGF